MTDAEIIKKIAEGDQQAFSRLVGQYQNMVFRVCMGFLHNSSDADDVCQEVFIEVHRSIGKFKGESKISTWLYRISVNKSLNYLRDNKRKSLMRSIESYFSHTDDSGIDIQSNQKQADEILENDDRKKALKQALNSLPENQRTAFVLHKYDDLPYKEIADIMNISLSSVESLLFRAKQNLQKKLLNFYKNMQ